MSETDKDFQAANEIGKIYNSFLDKTLLCDFFIDSTLVFVQASAGYLFMAGTQDKLWLESGSQEKKCPAGLQEEAETVFQSGKPVFKERGLYIPLVVRNSAIGLACFLKSEEAVAPFSERDMSLGCDLASHLASALKNILLFEQNLKMERLAAIGQTMSVVMHEVKNIIQLAKFAEEYLRMGIEGKNEKHLHRGLEGMVKAIREMDGFTYEILSLTKDYQISPEKVELSKLFEELRQDLLPKASQFNVELDFQVEEGFLPVDMESRSMYRTLLNIVKNAMEACDKEKSCIRIRVVSKPGETYELSVEDNGKGMTDETKARIFQAFFSTKGEKGTGLGLLVIDRTVKAHKGTVRVESEVGKGTRFILTLPKEIVSA